MNRRRISIQVFLCFLILMMMFLVVIGCSSGGDAPAPASTPTPTTSGISGKVADGYVSGATIKVYSDLDMTTEIGSGTTNSTGEFSITLNVYPVPSTIYIKTQGGIDIATNMPAPTMMFAGTYIDGSLNVTPLTDRVVAEYQQNISAGLDAAYTTIAGKLSVTTTTNDLKDNPVTNSTTQSGMYDILASGTQGNTLPDGDYEVKLLAYYTDEMIAGLSITGISDINSRVQTVTMTISNGSISGTYGSLTIEGRVQGTALYMNFYNDASNTVYRFAGALSLSAASGDVVKVMGGSIAAGRFLATFTLAGTTTAQSDNLFTALGNLINGQNYAVARNVFFASSPLISWGSCTISNFSSSGFNYDSLNIEAISSYNNVTSLVTGMSGSATFLTGSRIWVYSQAFTWGGQPMVLYQMGAAGNLRGLSLTVTGATYPVIPNKLAAISERTGMKRSEVGPLWESATTYNVQVAIIGMYMLGATRASLLDGVTTNGEMTFSGGSFTTPTFTAGALRIAHLASTDSSGAYVDKILSGSTIMTRSDDTQDWASFSDRDKDYLMSVEMYESGAMSGSRVQGGTVTINGTPNVPLKAFPMAMVMFARKDGTTPPDVNGTRNFLARSLYFKSSYGGTWDASTNYHHQREGWVYGTITLNTAAGTGSMTQTPAHGGVEATVPLTAEKILSGGIFTGMVHMSFNGGGGGVVDLFWPVGGPKATYVSTASDGTVQEVGEAYITE